MILTLSPEDIIRLPCNVPLPLIEEESFEPPRPLSETEPAPVQQLDGADSEWKYRGRNPSEASEPQPISAPVGLAAQQDEGFQRFYKAVISPTHVRVTAGGRIVPNTRGSCSPTAKWTKDTGGFDTDSASRHSHHDSTNHSALPMSGMPFGPMHHMMPGSFPHALAHGMQHLHAFPMAPWQLGFNGFNMTGPFVPSPGAFPMPPSSRLASFDSSKTEHEGTGSCESENTNPIHASPPDQFDHTRPFFYNGQWVMPPSPYFAYGMPGMSAMSGVSPPAMFNHAAHASKASESPVIAPKVSKRERHTEGASVAGASTAASQTTSNVANKSQPPISSIRPSEITKKQIDVLRGSLRYLEDQLQYNKHQIDEKWMEHQAQMVRQQIQQFEKNLDTQFKFEESHYPPKKYHDEQTASSKGNRKSISTPSLDEKDSGHAADTDFVQKRGKSKVAKVTSQLKPKSSFSGNPALTSSSSRNDAQPHVRATTLPMHAAMAAPFQPRHETTTPPANSSHSEVSADGLQKLSRSLRGTGSYRERKPNKPYLVGKLPAGVTRSHEQGVDYTYTRDLTEDELRARHMYWGKAPSHLQRGLPKFDGKDFYPPSPDRRLSTDTSSEDVVMSELPTNKTAFDPFRSLGRGSCRVARMGPGKSTQSESLAHPESHEHSDAVGSPVIRPESSQTQVGRFYNEFRSALGASSVVGSDNSQGRGSSDEGDDDKGLLFKGRKSMNRTGLVAQYCQHLPHMMELTCNRQNARNEILQSMLRKGKTSANAVPGTVSSTTVQGVLPQYAGHATAYLAPTLANTSVSPRASPKTGQAGNVSLTGSDKAENMPPCNATEGQTMVQADFAKPTAA